MNRISLVAAVALAALGQGNVFAAETSAYAKAFKDAQDRNQPLMVLVGAAWCPGCQTMKQSVMPRLARSGGLSDVSYATVDADAEPALAGKLMQGSMIPQLIVFRQEGGKWQREQITGATSDAEVKRLIARAVTKQDKDKTVELAGDGGND
jgi:thioredoxin-like negative regulator of GroEL